MFLRSIFFACLATIFVVFAFVILPMNNALANEHADKHYQQAEKHYKDKKWEEAVNEYKNAIKYDSDNPLYYKDLGWAYYELEKYTDAEKNLSKAISFKEIKPHILANAYTALALVYRDVNPPKKDEAKKYFISAANIWYYSVNSEDAMQNAINNLDEALRIDDKDANAYNLRGWAYFYSEKSGEALKDFKVAIDIYSKNPESSKTPDCAMAHRGLGLAYEKQGENQEAKSEFLKSGKIFISYKKRMMRNIQNYVRKQRKILNTSLIRSINNAERLIFI